MGNASAPMCSCASHPPDCEHKSGLETGHERIKRHACRRKCSRYLVFWLVAIVCNHDYQNTVETHGKHVYQEPSVSSKRKVKRSTNVSKKQKRSKNRTVLASAQNHLNNEAERFCVSTSAKYVKQLRCHGNSTTSNILDTFHNMRFL